MSKAEVENLDRLFFPRSIAVIGASPRSDRMRWGGKAFLEGLMKQNYRGRIFPVNPRGEDVLGVKAYRRVSEIPDGIDLAIFSIPPSAVLETMADCVRKRVLFAQLFTSGFKETGSEAGAELEKEMMEVARRGGIRVIGPNCMGVYCPEGGVGWTGDFPVEQGSVGFISQSGQLAGDFIIKGHVRGIRFSKVISYGNACDLECHHFLRYLAEDDKTRVIGAYIEGLKDGQAFVEIVGRLKGNKTLVVWKAGRTEAGSRAAGSHTGSIAGSQEIWQGLCKQTGMIAVSSMDELILTITALQNLKLPLGPNVAIMGGGGGESVAMTDLAEGLGLKVPHLSPETIQQLNEFVPVEGQSVKNPLDIYRVIMIPEHFQRIIALLRDDLLIDILIYLQPLDYFRFKGSRSLAEEIMSVTIDAAKELKKPMLLVLLPGLTMEAEMFIREAHEIYREAGVATFPTFADAAGVARNLVQYQRYLTTKG